MISRTQIISQLVELKNFRFVAYIGMINHSEHVVRLTVLPWAEKGLSTQIHTQDFIVFERNGYLSALNKDLNIKIDKLT